MPYFQDVPALRGIHSAKKTGADHADARAASIN